MKKVVFGLMAVFFTSSVCFGEIFFWEDKSGINSTEDISKLPPKFRAKYEKYMREHSKTEPKTADKAKSENIADKAIPDSAVSAVKALKKLQAKCQAGINHPDFTSALGDTKFEVNMFVQGKSSNDFPELKKSVTEAMAHYEKAGVYLDTGAQYQKTYISAGDYTSALKMKDLHDDMFRLEISRASKEVDKSFSEINK
ncbi:hypothetical protein GMST_10800 [Geomonas silvestris]|uniref:Lipoprotein n=1 Tax=Geomonas silvestris TaxID=2740184 RepID=A0A6V8MFI0_9BACT|nr:hypothetical protein [Geomonas silvestris]GFO58755.1 hypothetical protein GMST_10800 [Geomonas silvestris]